MDINQNLIRKHNIENLEMTQWLQALADLVEDPDLFFFFNISWFTTIHNTISRISDTVLLSLVLVILGAHICM